MHVAGSDFRLARAGEIEQADALAAAQRVLRRKGLAAVTLDAVASAAGEPRSSVWYYFGDKRTLVQKLVEARMYSLRTNLLRRARSLPSD